MLDLFFADDSAQDNPSREGMGPLVATGFVHVPGENVRDLERTLQDICADVGFPDGEEGEFKWSPGRELWMHDNLIEDERERFFERVIEAASDRGGRFCVVVGDRDRGRATDATDHTTDVTTLLLERADWRLQHADRSGLVVVDRPSGGRADETDFLRKCLETITAGTNYRDFDNLAVNAVSTPSSLIRCLQLADVVTACATSRISGEDRWSPTVFDMIKPHFSTGWGQVAGTGLKIQPALRYMNLYYWLIQEDRLQMRQRVFRLPDERRPYAASPTVV